jgi:hypothetical protein
MFSNMLIGSASENEIVRFVTLIDEAKAIENQAKQLIAPEKYSFRGSINMTGEIRNYFASLKCLQSRYKAPKHGVTGLILDTEDERCLDRITKDLSWLVRTLGFSVLHTDEINVEETRRLPLSELVWLYDRIPHEGDEVVGDIPRIVVRVKELYEAAEMWQERVQSLLSLSIRGAKRRHVTSHDVELDGHDSQAKVSNLQLAELAKDPILESVLIPSESAVRDVLRKVEEFEKLMHDLLGKDFDGAAADRAPYPEGSSFVGAGDEFHLYRLTGSPMYASLKSSISEISHISADIAADTPGKEVFEWICQCVSWINAINDAVTEVSPFGGRDRLVIPVGESARLLDQGRTLFLDVSEDIKKSLSAQRIGISTNKQYEKLTVTIAKGGALHSVGGTVIKWCPLIYDWLKQDLDSHHMWVERANVIIDEANQSRESLMQSKDISQGSLNNVYCLAESLRIHLDDGRDSLVVVPAKPLIDQITSLHMFLWGWINTNTQSTTEAGAGLSLKIAVADRYHNTNILVKERHTLLDSLLIRRRIEPLSSSEDVPLPSADSDVREKARSKLENKVMKKVARMMSLGVEGRGDVALHCALKAWEIEGAAFSEYGDEITVTSQYTSKLATIIKNLDPVKNPTLCARVLVNQVAAWELLEMSGETILTQDVRDINAKARGESKTNANLVAGTPKSSQSRSSAVKNLMMMGVTSTVPILNTAKPAIRPSSLPSMPPLNPAIPVEQARASFPVVGGDAGQGDTEKQDAAVQTVRLTIAAKPPPPPPPPLIMQLVPLPSAPRISRANFAISQSGSDTFEFVIAGDDHKYKFQAKLEMDPDYVSDLDGLLQDSIASKGRLPVDSYKEFIATKSRSGRSTIVVLRVSVCGGSRDFKQFYKDYESKERLAICELDAGHQLFLVTPKYHSASKVIRDQLVQKQKTYAVLIRKRSDRFTSKGTRGVNASK